MQIKEEIALISRGAIDLISPGELTEKLQLSRKNKKPLIVKAGFDPTARDIHLGHTVLLRKLRQFQDLGHIVYFLIGDFTAQVGDPSGRMQLRPLLSSKEIKDNAQTYTTQAFKILDRKKTKVVFNSSWYSKMSLSQFSAILSHYTVARLLERDDFSKRFRQNQPLSMLEFVYPLLQGYDSVMLDADIEIGGSDQKFNLIVGRHLQQAFGKKPQVVITLPLLTGLDGRDKMSKSLGNYIGITDDSKDMFGKVMSISDELMKEYYHLLTDFDLSEIEKIHPKEAKIKLAEFIVSCYYGKEEAQKQKKEFERVFSHRKIPEQINAYKCQDSIVNIIEVLYAEKLVKSKNEARRLISQGGVSIVDKGILQEEELKVDKEIVLKIGKKRFLKLLPNL